MKVRPALRPESGSLSEPAPEELPPAQRKGLACTSPPEDSAEASLCPPAPELAVEGGYGSWRSLSGFISTLLLSQQTLAQQPPECPAPC